MATLTRQTVAQKSGPRMVFANPLPGRGGALDKKAILRFSLRLTASVPRTEEGSMEWQP